MTILKKNELARDYCDVQGIQLIDSFYLTDHYILTKGEIHNPVLPLSQSNRAILGNIEEKLSNYINQY